MEDVFYNYDCKFVMICVRIKGLRWVFEFYVYRSFILEILEVMFIAIWSLFFKYCFLVIIVELGYFYLILEEVYLYSSSVFF